MTAEPDIAEQLSRFVARLADKHSDPDIVFSLRLAQAGLAVLDQAPGPAPGIAVIGPTQTGKSTVVNVIAGGPYVETSPLAAHTRQASVLAVNMSSSGLLGAQRLIPEELSGVSPKLVSRGSADCPPCLIWDTPDFDSNASAVYRQQVARVCALADLVVVVVSKEKYADQSVWTVLEAVAPLQLPALICLNKCESGVGSAGGTRSDAEILVPAIRRRLDGNPRVSADLPILTLPLVRSGELDALLERPDVQVFRRAVFERLALRSGAARRAGMERLLQKHWAGWIAPVEEEIACRREWVALLDAGARSFLDRYRSEYIDHARHHDVARKAILGLLELLELPVLAAAMSHTRRVLTWPLHRLSSLLGKTREAGRDQELKVLDAGLEHYLLSLRSEVSSRRHPWWRILGEELDRREPNLRREFHESVDQYRRRFQPRIDALSGELYARLERNPVGLNALRATRAAADAGGIVLAMKTGTVGLYDALLAPAVISVTSYLTESAVGQYLKSVIGRLKREQVEEVAVIIRGTLERPLGELHPESPELFGITQDQLARAKRQLQELGR